MVAYATALGKTASDIGTGGGAYARALAAEIVKPGVEIRARLLASGAQGPSRDRSRSFPLCFDNAGSVFCRRSSCGRAAIAGAATADGQRRVERAAAFIRETDDQARLEAFIKQFADTAYAEMARARLEELRRAATAPLPISREPPFDHQSRTKAAALQRLATVGLPWRPHQLAKLNAKAMPRVAWDGDTALTGYVRYTNMTVAGQATKRAKRYERHRCKTSRRRRQPGPQLKGMDYQRSLQLVFLGDRISLRNSMPRRCSALQRLEIRPCERLLSLRKG